MRKGLLTVTGVAAAATAVVFLVTAPGAEAPTVPLGRAVQDFTLAAPTTTYSAEATAGRWSVLASTAIVSAGVRSPGGAFVAGTTAGATDQAFPWIAMDHHAGRRETGTYLVDVSGSVGAPVRLQFLDGGPALTSGTTTTIGESSGDWLVDLREVYLHTGDVLSLAVTGSAVGSVAVLHSAPSSWAVTQATADRSFALDKPESTQVTNLVFTARASAPYAVVFERGWWDPTAQVTTRITPRPRVPIPPLPTSPPLPQF